jgi:hypothetical protein
MGRRGLTEAGAHRPVNDTPILPLLSLCTISMITVEYKAMQPEVRGLQLPLSKFVPVMNFWLVAFGMVPCSNLGMGTTAYTDRLFAVFFSAVPCKCKDGTCIFLPNPLQVIVNELSWHAVLCALVL